MYIQLAIVKFRKFSHYCVTKVPDRSTVFISVIAS